MPLESNVQFISDLEPSNPIISDPREEGTNHLRNIKQSLRNTFPNVTGKVSATQDQLNALSDYVGSDGLIVPKVRYIDFEQSDTPYTDQDTYLRLSLWEDKYNLTKYSKADSSKSTWLYGTDMSGNFASLGNLTAGGGVFAAGGTELCPVGSIMLWWGTLASIPKGWVVCNGANGTPDLRNRVPRGAWDDNGRSAGGSDTQQLSVSGGTASAGGHTHSYSTDWAGQHSHGGNTAGHALTWAEMPEHYHNYTWSGITTEGHGTNTMGSGGDPSKWNGVNSTSPAGGSQPHSHGISDDGNHYHTGGTTNNGEHTHSLTANGSVSVMQAYMGLHFIMRVS